MDCHYQMNRTDTKQNINIQLQAATLKVLEFLVILQNNHQ